MPCLLTGRHGIGTSGVLSLGERQPPHVYYAAMKFHVHIL